MVLFEKKMLFSKALSTSTTRVEMFNCSDFFMKENEIVWFKYTGVTTDGACAMSGKYKGLPAKIKEVALSVEWAYRSTRREALAIIGMNQDLKDTLHAAVKIVNLIKSQLKDSRHFGSFMR